MNLFTGVRYIDHFILEIIFTKGRDAIFRSFSLQTNKNPFTRDADVSIMYNFSGKNPQGKGEGRSTTIRTVVYLWTDLPTKLCASQLESWLFHFSTRHVRYASLCTHTRVIIVVIDIWEKLNARRYACVCMCVCMHAHWIGKLHYREHRAEKLVRTEQTTGNNNLLADATPLFRDALPNLSSQGR